MDTKVQVLETNILHADGALLWLDATSGDPDDPETLAPVREPLAVTLSTYPRDLRWRAKPGQLVLWRRPAGPPAASIVDGVASEAERARPALTPYRVAGTAADPAGRFNPLAFDLDITGDAGQPLLLYRSPVGAMVPAGNTVTGGVLVGRLVFEQTGDPALDGTPARWARLRLDVTLVPADGDNPAQVRAFVAQADAHGDFRLLLSRLPALPDGVPSYTASLSATAPTGAAPEAPPAAGFAAMRLGSTRAPFALAAALALDLVPGGVARLDSAARTHLAVAPA
ncbi:carboxypeptidase regulatory-like domain-containing protein [uncultured Thiohalocapsa sp.]|uniref:carboxypeptidase regulatory-like domain-containing protein n=1 Tax=uncultured Thiohalocapsa sp. TaxID=768990 RepID=UPI0025F4E85F|nr:carboxypeptidase regulatory-like domain-containing protein [uncultured Thiohalocapsa sp.]